VSVTRSKEPRITHFAFLKVSPSVSTIDLEALSFLWVRHDESDWTVEEIIKVQLHVTRRIRSCLSRFRVRRAKNRGERRDLRSNFAVVRSGTSEEFLPTMTLVGNVDVIGKEEGLPSLTVLLTRLQQGLFSTYHGAIKLNARARTELPRKERLATAVSLRSSRASLR
jgi:hypothetical protein